MKTQTLKLIRGIPGSGKSTLAKNLDGILLEADMYFVNKDGEYKHDKRFIKEAHSWCQIEMKRLLLAGYDVVVANTFIKAWEITNYLNIAQSLGLDLEIELIEATGNYKNVHGVPDEIVKRMKSQYEPFVVKPVRPNQESQMSMGL